MCAIISSIFFAVGLFAFAIFLLGWRDMRRNQKYQESRPLQERIDEIRESALSDAKWCSWYLALGEERGDGERFFWHGPVSEYNRRLADLASSAETRPEEASALGEEANEYLREHKIKGVPVGYMAKRLGELLEERDLGNEDAEMQ